jgi:hypothetical protein
MASLIVETFVPGDAQDRFAAEADGIRMAAEAIMVANGRVHLVRSYLVPGDEMGYHVVEADNAEDVARVTMLAGIEVERIVQAIGVGPSRATATDSEGAS